MSTLSIPSTSPTWFQSVATTLNQWRLRREAARVQRLALRARAQRNAAPLVLAVPDHASSTPLVLDLELDLAQRVRLVGEW